VRVVDPLGDTVPTIEVAKMVIRAAVVVENAIEHTRGDAGDVPRPRRFRQKGIGAQRSSAPCEQGRYQGEKGLAVRSSGGRHFHGPRK
jgi:hypothetical protein